MLGRGERLGHRGVGALDLGADALAGGAGEVGELAHLVGDHREAAPHLAGAGGLDRRVEREQVGLLGDLADLARHAHQLLGDLGEAGDRLRQALLLGERGVEPGEHAVELAAGVADHPDHAVLAAVGGGLARAQQRVLQAVEDVRELAGERADGGLGVAARDAHVVVPALQRRLRHLLQARKIGLALGQARTLGLAEARHGGGLARALAAQHRPRQHETGHADADRCGDACHARHEQAEQQRTGQPGGGVHGQRQELRIRRGGSLGSLGHLGVLHCCRARLATAGRFVCLPDLAHGTFHAKMDPIRGVPLTSGPAAHLPATCTFFACIIPVWGV